MHKVKIIDTIGPSTEDYDNLPELVEAGMDVAHPNRSHGTPEDYLEVYNNVRRASETTGRNVATPVDLQGPKVRCSWFRKNADGEDKAQLQFDQKFVIITDDAKGDEHITSAIFKNLPGDCHSGDPILVNDGKVRLGVTKVEGNNVYIKVVTAGPVSPHKGISLSGVAVSLLALTEKDEADLRQATRTGVGIVVISFVRFATDINHAHEITDEEGHHIPTVAKIEKSQAPENLEKIVRIFDGVAAVRGGTAVECPLEKVPLTIKHIAELARQYAKPIVAATGILSSMMNSLVPTCAKASDCASAIFDGSGATITFNKTAVGRYPDATVATMARISGYATDYGLDRTPELKNLDMSSADAVSPTVMDLADRPNAKAVVAYTQTGAIAYHVSHERPTAPVYSLTSSEHTYHWLILSWGTGALLFKKDHHDKLRKDSMVYTDKVPKDVGRVADDGEIVILSSVRSGHQPDHIDSIHVHIVGACDWFQASSNR